MESAGQKPEGWPGWPEENQFALLLVHDVESQRGVDRVKPLAELEMSLGFRSAFYFIPEGSYRVPASLLSWLKDRGFEVGVHDLHHDGKLFQDRETFRKNAERINYYLKEWGAVGFRPGFTFHNLNWTHDLNIEYDSSTFDTDPFEPQPEGVGTIFPFWVPGSVSAPSTGYIELPYTLPQDSTLFNLFREQTIGIWSRKLAWIALRGGLALLNVHPDYLACNHDVPSAAGVYSMDLYRNFLHGLCDTQQGKFWHGPPVALVRWVRTALASTGQRVGRASIAPLSANAMLAGNRGTIQWHLG